MGSQSVSWWPKNCYAIKTLLQTTLFHFNCSDTLAVQFSDLRSREAGHDLNVRHVVYVFPSNVVGCAILSSIFVDKRARKIWASAADGRGMMAKIAGEACNLRREVRGDSASNQR